MIIQLHHMGKAAENTRILQQAFDQGGTIRIDQPGIYDFDGHLTIGDNTALECGSGVFIRRTGDVREQIPPFLYNKGLENGTFNHDIRIEGLHLITNGVDMTCGMTYPGLRAHVSFVGIRNLTVRDYEVHDLEKVGYGIQIVNFENILLENLYIEGKKDGVHLGRGSKFTIRHAKFRTFDDPIALNAYDYCMSNYQYGWIEDGLIEDCYDLDDKDTTGFFCRLLGGTWCDWYKGMEVQNSTLAVHNGILYSASVTPVVKRENPLLSMVPPMHESGLGDLIDGVRWRAVQKHDGNYDAGCRRITFRDIFLQKNRKIAFAFEMCTPPWAISVPKGLPIPPQEDIFFDGIYSGKNVEYLLHLDASVKNIHISNSSVEGNVISSSVLPGQDKDYFPTQIIMNGVSFKRNAALLTGTTAGHFRIVLSGCSIPDGCELTSEGNVQIESAGIPIRNL